MRTAPILYRQAPGGSGDGCPYDERTVRRSAITLAVLLAPGAFAGRPVVSAWLPTNWDADNALASLHAGAGILTSVSPVWYWARADGGVDARLPGGKRGESVGPVETHVREFCRSHEITLVPLISNSSPGKNFDPEMISRILNTTVLREAHVCALVSLVTSMGYDGIEIDY